MFAKSNVRLYLFGSRGRYASVVARSEREARALLVGEWPTRRWLLGRVCVAPRFASLGVREYV